MTNQHLARMVHQIDARHLAFLVRGPVQFTELNRPIRTALSRHISTRRRTFGTWQEAWNDLTGARPGRPGQLVVTPERCLDCRGRRLVVDRRLGRVGPCLTCMGRGSSSPVTLTAMCASPPSSG